MHPTCVIRAIPSAEEDELLLLCPTPSSSSRRTETKMLNNFTDLGAFGEKLTPRPNKKNLLLVDTPAAATAQEEGGMTPPLTPITLDHEEELEQEQQEEPCFCIFPFVSFRAKRQYAVPVPSPSWALLKDHHFTERTIPCDDSEMSSRHSSFQSFDEIQDGDGGSSRTIGNAVRDSMGYLGLALFSPLDEDFFEGLSDEDPYKLKNHVNENDLMPNVYVVSDNESSEEEHEEESLPRIEDSIPINLELEPPHILSEYPPIISQSLMQQISDRGLPLTAKLMKWSRIYSLTRDGDHFQTMIQNCARYHHTVVVIKTTGGDILGGYADSPWKKQEGYQLGSSFYGSGQAFLFATNPSIDEVERHDCSPSSTPYVHIYHWTGENTYCQICDEDGGRIAMGGGGSFGLLVEDNFIVGSSGHCSTFGNPPLTRETDEGFDVLDMEVYGLKTSLL